MLDKQIYLTLNQKFAISVEVKKIQGYEKIYYLCDGTVFYDNDVFKLRILQRCITAKRFDDAKAI